ncbi:CDI system double-stranded DNA deaminase immunity protein DddI [Burkholderia gladioli]|uniref:CDI system double-stranded DNA deaminase immunity protein DddI n=1 Tax=Burkholderia gladioli TaxID=28095 RepID=UPI001641157F|nr:Imm1 family immunity protein [Burkholderia gladioli]
MYADDFDGENGVASLDDLIEFLNRKPAFNANNFTLTFEEDGFPQLNIFLKDDIAVVYYMDAGENFVSQGKSQEDAVETFYENKLGGEVKLAKSCVVSRDEAIEAAKQFFSTKKRPDVLSWDEL